MTLTLTTELLLLLLLLLLFRPNSSSFAPCRAVPSAVAVVRSQSARSLQRASLTARFLPSIYHRSPRRAALSTYHDGELLCVRACVRVCGSCIISRSAVYPRSSRITWSTGTHADFVQLK